MKRIICFLLVIAMIASIPAALADIVIPGVNGGAPTIIPTPGDDKPYRPNFSVAGEKAAEYEKLYDRIMDLFMHTSSYSLSLAQFYFDEDAKKIAIGFQNGVSNAKIAAFLAEFGGSAEDFRFFDGTIVGQVDATEVELSAVQVWKEAPYADKALNKMKNVSLAMLYKTVRNTATELHFEIRNQGTKAIVIEGGFYLERKTQAGWQRLSAALKNKYGSGETVEIPGDVDSAGQTVTFGPLENGEYRVVADAALKSSPTKTYPISANFSVADYGFANYDTEGWVPTLYGDSELNTVSTFSMTTEHPVYQPGASTISVLLKNTRRASLTYGLDFFLERKTQTGWQHYYRPNVVVPAIGYELAARTSYGMRIDIADLPPLIEGEYRLIKRFFYDGRSETPFLASAAFTVAENGYDSAYLSGYTPLELLPAAYAERDAIQDGVLFLDASGVLHNQDHLLTFLQRAAQGLEAKIRVLRYDELGAPLLTDVTFRTPYSIALRQDRTRSAEKEKWAETNYNHLSIKRVGGKDALVIENTDRGDIGEWIVLFDIAKVGASKVNGYLKLINRG